MHTESESNSHLTERVCFNPGCSLPFGPGSCGYHHAAGNIQILSTEQEKDKLYTVSTEGTDNKFGQGDLPEPVRSLVDTDNRNVPTAGKHLNSHDNGSQLEVSGSQTISCSSPSSSPIVSRTASLKGIDAWLDEIFRLTLEAQVHDEIFVGGAEDCNPENPCPICFQPLGDERDQHFLKCKFAHEEQARLEKSFKRGLELRGRR